MAKEDTGIKATAREKMLALARDRFPERNFADLDAQEPAADVADLDEAINEIIEGYATQQAEMDEKNSRLVELLKTDPDSVDVFLDWMDNGDFRSAIVNVFGDELGISEEAGQKFKEGLEGWREKRQAAATLEEESRANWENSLAELSKWGDAKGLSVEQMRDVMLRLLAITYSGMENKYTADDFDLAFNAQNYSNDVAAARQAGEVAGRNARMAETRRERAGAGGMPPVAAGSQGGFTRERAPKRESDSPWAGVK